MRVLVISFFVCILTSCSYPQYAEPEQIIETPAPVVVEESKKTAYITIDDGPSRENTPRILDLLKEKGIKATFFVLPHNGVDDIYQRIHDEGHEIANHSYSHDYNKLYSADSEYFKTDVLRMQEYLQDKLGVTTNVYRFPGGSRGRNEMMIEQRKQILADLGYRWFDWDVTTGDSDPSAAGKNVDALVNNVVLNSNDKEKLVVLMHDAADKTATPMALAIIIEQLYDQGYAFDILGNY